MPADLSPDSKLNDQSAADIRRQKRLQRQQLSAVAQRHNSLSLCSNIIRERVFHNSQRIACYLANDGEIDPSPVIEHAWSMGKQVYLPILSPLKANLQNSLYFAPYDMDSKLRLNRFNIPEPECKPAQWTRAAQLDLLLLPLVAFDESGNRVGMGGGFYDRTLAYLKNRQHWKKPTLIGLAHELQKVAQLQTQHWDVPLDFVITEKRQYGI